MLSIKGTAYGRRAHPLPLGEFFQRYQEQDRLRRLTRVYALAFDVQPADGFVGVINTATVTVSGAVPGSTVTLTPATGAATSGNTAVANGSGVATFSALVLDTYAAAQTLTASAPGAVDAVSDAFVVAGGAQSQASIYDMALAMAAWPDTTPLAGDSLAINGASLGSYDWRKVAGNQTVSAFDSADWFTTTEDSRCAFVVVDGDLTINSGQTFRPAKRKLFTVLYVTGTLTVDGEISMSARGANHGAAAGNVAGADIRIFTGTAGGIANPQVPAAGGAGGVSVTYVGSPGSAGTNGGTGGGGSGAKQASDDLPGSGAAGTSFSGGAGAGAACAGGGGTPPESDDATPNGGAGSAGVGYFRQAGGGAGNPGGAGSAGGSAGGTGIGGVLIVICETLAGAGAISAAGVAGGDSAHGSGGGSGGGSVTILYGADSSTITPTAAGGAAGTAGNHSGGAGGAGTARKLEIGA